MVITLLNLSKQKELIAEPENETQNNAGVFNTESGDHLNNPFIFLNVEQEIKDENEGKMKETDP